VPAYYQALQGLLLWLGRHKIADWHQKGVSREAYKWQQQQLLTECGAAGFGGGGRSMSVRASSSSGFSSSSSSVDENEEVSSSAIAGGIPGGVRPNHSATASPSTGPRSDDEDGGRTARYVRSSATMYLQGCFLLYQVQH
jgi:hypothetical protein